MGSGAQSAVVHLLLVRPSFARRAQGRRGWREAATTYRRAAAQYVLLVSAAETTPNCISSKMPCNAHRQTMTETDVDVAREAYGASGSCGLEAPSGVFPKMRPGWCRETGDLLREERREGRGLLPVPIQCSSALPPSRHSPGRWQATTTEVRGRDPLGPWSTPMQPTILRSTVGRKTYPT